MSRSDAPALSALAVRIRDEITDLDRVARRALDAWPRAQTPSTDQHAYLDSVALNVHGLYSGVERLLELIARQVDRATPGGEMWHRDLLYQMTREVSGVRPAVLTGAHAAALDDLRRFRHLVRNLYATHLDPQRMSPLLAALPVLWQEVRSDLIAFAAFLEDLAQR